MEAGADVDVGRGEFFTEDVEAGTLTSSEPPPHPEATRTPTTSNPDSRLRNPERQNPRRMPPVVHGQGKRCRLSPTSYQTAPPRSEKPTGGNSRRLLLPDVESEPGSGPDHDKSKCAKDRGERQEEGGESRSPDGGE